jgi:hypothetical protein
MPVTTDAPITKGNVKPSKPSIFIASTRNGLQKADRISSLLSERYNPLIWGRDSFPPGETALESLLRVKGEVSFAVIIFTIDTCSPITSQPSPNLVFEAGFFISSIGQQKVAICVETGITLPSDLNGYNSIEFETPNDFDQNSFRDVANEIGRMFDRALTSPVELYGQLSPRMNESPLDFGDSRHTSVIVDAAFQPIDRKGLKAELQKSIQSRRVFPTRSFYVTEEGASAWLELVRDPGYTFYQTSIRFLREKASDIANIIHRTIGDKAPDIIGLGSGDGEKDGILLGAISPLLATYSPSESIAYYPIDFSYYLIIEAIKTIPRYVNLKHFKIKPIVGDIMDLASFRYVYEKFPNPNVFMLLGNTLGNNDERYILDSLKRSLYPGDLALIEVNINQDTRDSADHIFGRKNLNHNLALLSVVGIEIDEAKFGYEIECNASPCPNTVSLKTNYTLSQGETIHISVNHRYSFEHFLAWISDSLGCQVVWKDHYESVGLVLLEKPSDRRTRT